MTTVLPLHPVEGVHVEAWLLSKSGRYAWVQFTTKGPEVKIPATHVKESA